MRFEELKKTVAQVGFTDKRSDQDNYLEVVIVKKNLAELIVRFDSMFGSAAGSLSPRMKEAIAEFGGLISGQTLYFCEQNGSFIFAMLWPWQDGEHITLKLAQKK